ncbi:MAG: radical SAM protein [Syntrophales bacterium]|nr:radical SAM protein [Syntrophales bacterium]
MSCLLIYPPIVKPSEPPPGIAMLAGELKGGGVDCAVLDANIEGILHLIESRHSGSDTWTRRAKQALPNALKTVRKINASENPDKYRRAVSDINRILAVSAGSPNIRLSLSDYRDDTLSPLRSGDCVKSFEHPEINPFFSYFRERLPGLFESNEPSVIGISLNYLSQALTSFALMGYLRKVVPAAKIVVGGGLATSWMRSPAWRNPFRGIADIWVDGPGENPLLSLFGKDDKAYRSIPRYDGLAMRHYLSPGFILPYSASRGCYWRQCTFCPEKAEGNEYSSIPPKLVTKELQELVRDGSPVLIHFLDNAISPSLLEELALNPPGVPWYGFARITEHLADPAFCHDLKRSGCVMLKLGLESGSQEVLDALRKGVSLDMASRVLGNLRKAGIATYVYLLFGTPAETHEKARKTLDFTLLHRESIGFVNVALFNLPAWGEESASLESESFYDGDLMLYRNFSHPRGWNRPQVRSFIDREFKRHPEVASIIRRDPPFFSSNHAPFFCMQAILSEQS